MNNPICVTPSGRAVRYPGQAIIVAQFEALRVTLPAAPLASQVICSVARPLLPEARQ